MSKPFSSSWHLSTTLQVSSEDPRTLQVIHFIWMGTNRLFRHFDVSKFCRRILWSIRHSLSFNLVSPGGPPSSYIARKLYRVFLPVQFQLFKIWDLFYFFIIFFWVHWGVRAWRSGQGWSIIHKRQGKVLGWGSYRRLRNTAAMRLCLAVIERRSGKVLQKTPAFLIRQPYLIQVHKGHCRRDRSRRSVEQRCCMTPHNVPPKGSDSTIWKPKPVQRSYLNGQLGALILFHRKPLQWPFNKNTRGIALKCAHCSMCFNRLAVPSGSRHRAFADR